MNDLNKGKIQSALFSFRQLWQSLAQKNQLVFIPSDIQIEQSLFPLTAKAIKSERTFMLYLQETQLHLTQLESYLTQDHQEKHNAQIRYLIEQIKNQFIVLVQIDQWLNSNQAKQKFKKKTFLNHESLYQKQARYRSYLTQLKQKREDLKVQVQNEFVQTQIEQLEQRIEKGKAMIAELEVKIEQQEKNN